MTESKEQADMGAYIEFMIEQHNKIIGEAQSEKDDELEHRAYWIKYAFMMMRDYLKYHRAGGHVLSAYDIAGMREK